jgi:hypothetical protein
MYKHCHKLAQWMVSVKKAVLPTPSTHRSGLYPATDNAIETQQNIHDTALPVWKLQILAVKTNQVQQLSVRQLWIVLWNALVDNV